MIYVILYSFMPDGYEFIMDSNFEMATTSLTDAKRIFSNLLLSEQYPRKQLWRIRPNGVREIMKEESYIDDDNGISDCSRRQDLL